MNVMLRYITLYLQPLESVRLTDRWKIFNQNKSESLDYWQNMETKKESKILKT